MVAFMMIVLTVIFPMSSAHSKDGESSYTVITFDPQRKMEVKCSLLKFKGKNAIVCTEKPYKEVKVIR